jgi:hypothetical protein
MSLIHAVTLDPAPLAPDDQPVWLVELRARVGPLARSKRLRMQRTVHDEPTRVVFERVETDGREHSMWRLTAEVRPSDTGTHLDVELFYGGRLWSGGVLERVLSDSIERGRERLLALVTADDTEPPSA